jgi:hypothetical protein
MSKRPTITLAAEHKAIAADIGTALGEIERIPLRQIARMVAVRGAEWVGRVAIDAASLYASDEAAPEKVALDGTARTLGGVFFQLARSRATAEGTVPRKVFCAVFYSPTPKDKTPAPATVDKPAKAAPAAKKAARQWPVSKPAADTPQAVAPAARSKRPAKYAMPEVEYVTPRRKL